MRPACAIGRELGHGGADAEFFFWLTRRTTQTVVKITLDAQRNSLLLLELRLTMGSVACTHARSYTPCRIPPLPLVCVGPILRRVLTLFLRFPPPERSRSAAAVSRLGCSA